MWSFLTKIGIFSRKDDVPTNVEDEFLNSYISKERKEDFQLREVLEMESEEYIGNVTFMNDKVAVINNQYYFHVQNTSLPTIKVGDKVKCVLYMNDLDTFVKNVEIIEDSEDESDEFVEPVEKVERNLDGMKELKISGKIVEKCIRKISVLPHDESFGKISFCLDSVSAEFIPLVGDIVELDTLLPEEGDEPSLIVEKINAKKCVTKRGTVTVWSSSRGVIDDFAEFSIHVCEAGYQPTKGDKVLACLIRSDCNGGYKWRAVQVVAQVRFTHVKLTKQEVEARRELLLDKQGVFITTCSKFVANLNTPKDFVVEVVNQSGAEKNLESVCLLSKAENCQITLLRPTEFPLVLEAGKVTPFHFRIDGKFVGRSSEQYVWVFTGFKIGRIFDFEVIDPDIRETSTEGCPTTLHAFHTKKDVSYRELMNRSSGVIMPGRRSFSPAAFVPVKLGQFALSDKILVAALPDTKMNLNDLMIRVEKVLPCLKEELSPKTYVARMHALLYLEEVAMLKQVGELQMDKTTFRKQGDCLVLDVPALSPYTTKLVAGDMLIASIPSADDRKYEGVIHRVTYTELWLQFAQDFHDSFKEGMQYSVSFVTSRASLRRMHQAINLAVKHLGYAWLFPTGIFPRPPQVVIEEEIEDWKKRGRYSQIATANFASSENDTQKIYGPDPRNVSATVNQKYLSIQHKFQIPFKPNLRLRNRRYHNQSRDIHWNRHGSGYGMHCSTDNEQRINIAPERTKTIRWFNKGLNEQQKEAVRNVLLGEARPLPYIIFGPPGTGKTITVVETILQIHALIPESRLLVATPSNSAADLIAERLLDVGDLEQDDLLRMVGYHYLEQGRISASIIPYSAVPDVKAINIPGTTGSSHEGVQMVGRELLGQHRITVGTLGCLGLLYNMGFPRGHFTHVVIDEAGQATEPELLIPMVFLHMEYGQVILAGDPLQLGPVVTSRLASRCGLQESLLARLLNRFPYARDPNGFPDSSGFDPRLVTKLVNNYRSLPTILRLTSMLFYDNDLIPNVSEETSLEARYLKALAPLLPYKRKKPVAPPLLFHGVRGTNLQETESHSWYNPQEVYQAFVYLNILYKAGLKPEQVGIITPYQLQSNKIRFMLEKENMEAPKVGSVEEFQGQEKIAIIVSVVRSSPELISYDMQRALGFVANARRLNVALSRARAILIILGNPHLLYLDMHWRSVLRHCVKNKFYTGCDLPLDFTLE